MDGDGMRAVPSPSGSNLPTFFRWCLGGMSAFASGSGSASARDADADASVLASMKEEEAKARVDCRISASQEDLLARALFIGGGGGGEEEEAEVFSTPPLTQQDPGQSQRGQAGEEEDGISMCSMPFTQTQPPPSPSPSPPPSPSPSPSSSSSLDSRERRAASKPRKRRICTRKVRRGAKILNPTPRPSPSPELDPLARLVLMIPTGPLPTTGDEDILELARSRGIFAPRPTTGDEDILELARSRGIFL